MRVLITGAGRAIGKATAIELRDRGHEVVATARDTSLLDDLDGVEALELDVRSDESVRAAIGAAGELDAVVNNAALSVSGPLEGYPVDTFAATLDTNVTGVLRVVQAVLPAWRERGSGVIVNISSVQGQVSTPMEGAYAASKYALEALSETMHYELRHFGIRTVIIQPGYIAPGMKHPVEHKGPEVYDELRRQWFGTSEKLTGDEGRTPTDVAAARIADAVEDPDSPLRVPIGADAERTLAVRRRLDDAAFEAAMRTQLDLTW
jgi:NAD(P)-dependent dehydrogenase (short-subunit alcohol dehydrogenase family)